MRLSVPRSLHCLVRQFTGSFAHCMRTTCYHSQALSFMRAIDAQSATVEKARYLAHMEQP